MAKTHVVLSRVTARSATGTGLPVADSAVIGAETVVPSGTSQATTLVSTENEATSETYVWTVTTDIDVWVKFGAAPTAAAGEDHLVLAGQTRDFTAHASDVVAVIEA